MKKINKYIKYMLFAVVLCIVTTGNVFASCSGETKACRECEYSFKYISDTVTVKYKAVDDGNGDIILRNEMSGSKGFAVSGNDIFGKVFKDKSGKKLYCPTLYYKTVMPGNSGGYIKIEIHNQKKEGFSQLDVKNMGGNDKKISEKKKKSAICEFTIDIKDSTGKIVSKGNKFNFNVTEGEDLPRYDTTGEYSLTFKDGISFNDFYKNGKCGYTLYILCQATKETDPGMTNGNAINYAPLCTISKEQIIFSDETEITEPEEKYETEEKKDNNKEVVTDDSEGCDAIKPLMGDLRTVWNIFKIAAPILAIIFGSVDFVQAVVSNDDQALKKATGKFSKRLMLAAALFFLPFLIELLFAISGLDEDLTSVLCDINQVEEE